MNTKIEISGSVTDLTAFKKMIDKAIREAVAAGRRIA